jgi:hypothetical protein
VDNTHALDFLLGWWDPATATRVNGRGLHDLAEIAAYRYGKSDALAATVQHTVDSTRRGSTWPWPTPRASTASSPAASGPNPHAIQVRCSTTSRCASPSI